MPGKLSVQGVPGVKRRDAAVGRALNWELSRRQDRPAWGRTPRWFWQVLSQGAIRGPERTLVSGVLFTGPGGLSGMFVADEVLLDLSFGAAAARLAEAVRGGR